MSLVNITFNKLSPQLAKRALLEGMMCGFTFKDFLQKNVYAIPFGKGYSLVGSIDNCRKIGQKSGIVGVSSPAYAEDEKGNIILCWRNLNLNCQSSCAAWEEDEKTWARQADKRKVVYCKALPIEEGQTIACLKRSK